MQLYKVYLLIIVLFAGDGINGEISDKLLHRYNNVVKSCFDPHQNELPAYQCSGLLIRGIRDGTGLKFAWSVKPDDQVKNAQSFAFLRRDQFFSHFPYEYSAGLILYPHLETPAQKNTYAMYCAFPTNARCDGRLGRYGCTTLPGDFSTAFSTYCHEKNITTIDKWIAHYYDVMLSGYDTRFSKRQCAFDMTKPTAARDFAIMSEANTFLRTHATEFAMMNNEVRIEAWDENEPSKLPIQAFFYIEDMDWGLATAQLYRDEYHVLTGEKLPIVSIRLPESLEGNTEIKDVRV